MAMRIIFKANLARIIFKANIFNQNRECFRIDARLDDGQLPLLAIHDLNVHYLTDLINALVNSEQCLSASNSRPHRSIKSRK